MGLSLLGSMRKVGLLEAVGIVIAEISWKALL